MPNIIWKAGKRKLPSNVALMSVAARMMNAGAVGVRSWTGLYDLQVPGWSEMETDGEGCVKVI